MATASIPRPYSNNSDIEATCLVRAFAYHSSSDLTRSPLCFSCGPDRQFSQRDVNELGIDDKTTANLVANISLNQLALINCLWQSSDQTCTYPLEYYVATNCLLSPSTCGPKQYPYNADSSRSLHLCRRTLPVSRSD